MREVASVNKGGGSLHGPGRQHDRSIGPCVVHSLRIAVWVASVVVLLVLRLVGLRVPNSMALIIEILILASLAPLYRSGSLHACGHQR